MLPEISVILPIYNGGKLLDICIKSILNQSFENFELIISDDASTDNSLVYIESIIDPRIKVLKNKYNKGLFSNLNILIAESKSNLIKLWAQDDIMYPNCLDEFVKFHTKHGDISFSYCDRDIIDENNNIIYKSGFDPTPERISPWLHAKIMAYTGSITGNISNVCINKKYLFEIGYFREDMKYSGDIDMWERLSREYSIGRIAVPLIQLRNHDKQLSRQHQMSVFNIKENTEVLRNLEKRLPKDLQGFYKKCNLWKRHIMYFTVFLNHLRNGRMQLAIEYYNEIKKIDSILLLLLRWPLVKVLDKSRIKIIKLDMKPR